MKKKPLIALDFAFFDHANLGAGQYRYVVQLAHGYAMKSDFRFLVIGSRPDPVPELREIIETNPDWDYASLPHHTYRLNDLTYQWRYAWLLFRKGVDLFHATHVFVPVLAPCPVVMTKHDLMEEIFDDYAPLRSHRPYRMHRWSSRHQVKRIISISQSTHDDLVKYFQITPEKSVVIHHGIDHNQPVEQPAFMNEPEWIPYLNHDKPWILSPFNLEPRKNLLGLCHALPRVLESFPDLRLVLFGKASVTPPRLEAFEKCIRELGIHNALHRVGFVSDSQLKWFYSQADVFVFPTWYEGFGYPIIEAMSAGGCVVSNHASSMAELMQDIGVGTDVKDPTQFADAILSLLRDPDRRHSLGIRGQEYARTFTLTKMIEKTFTVYLDILKIPHES